MDNLQSICTSLDEIILEFFSTLDEICQTQIKLEATLKNGYFLMAKARYTMGANAVGTLQYNIDDLENAGVKVNIDSSKEEKTLSFKAIRGGDLLEKEISLDNESTTSNNLRKRHVKKEENEEERDEEDQSDQHRIEDVRCNGEYESRCVKSMTKDPLKWFGVLVPQTLRQSQTNFQTATDVCCHLVTLKQRLLRLKSQYRDLLEEKKKLLPEATAEGNAVEDIGVVTDTQ